MISFFSPVSLFFLFPFPFSWWLSNYTSLLTAITEVGSNWRDIQLSAQVTESILTRCPFYHPYFQRLLKRVWQISRRMGNQTREVACLHRSLVWSDPDPLLLAVQKKGWSRARRPQTQFVGQCFEQKSYAPQRSAPLVTISEKLIVTCATDSHHLFFFFFCFIEQSLFQVFLHFYKFNLFITIKSCAGKLWC